MLDMGFEPQIRRIVEQSDMTKKGWWFGLIGFLTAWVSTQSVSVSYSRSLGCVSFNKDFLVTS